MYVAPNVRSSARLVLRSSHRHEAAEMGVVGVAAARGSQW